MSRMQGPWQPLLGDTPDIRHLEVARCRHRGRLADVDDKHAD
jgi:hypothetical protein